MSRDTPPFRVGDKVTTRWRRGEVEVVRRVTGVERFQRCQSGWKVAADAGEPCPHCGRPEGEATGYIDSDWFKLHKEPADD